MYSVMTKHYCVFILYLKVAEKGQMLKVLTTRKKY